jgi:hypothetical protein
MDSDSIMRRFESCYPSQNKDSKRKLRVFCIFNESQCLQGFQRFPVCACECSQVHSGVVKSDLCPTRLDIKIIFYIKARLRSTFQKYFPLSAIWIMDGNSAFVLKPQYMTDMLMYGLSDFPV